MCERELRSHPCLPDTLGEIVAQPSTQTSQPLASETRQHNIQVAGGRRRAVSKSRAGARRTQGGYRGLGFTEAEIDSLLSTVSSIRPVCGEQWSQVAAVYKTKWPEMS